MIMPRVERGALPRMPAFALVIAAICRDAFSLKNHRIDGCKRQSG